MNSAWILIKCSQELFGEASGVRQTFKSAEYSRSFVHCCVLVERWCVRRGLKSIWNG